MKPPRRPTNPDHKARLSFGVVARCSCGWSSTATHFGKGARQGALSEWHWHRDQIDKACTPA